MIPKGKFVTGPDVKPHARTLSRAAWGGDRPRLSPIASVVAVHRLREVSCLYGFTRFEAAPTAIDGDLEELFIAVEGAALATELDWLPAVEQLGEDVFLRFDAEALKAWLARPAAAARADALLRGWNDGARPRPMPTSCAFPASAITRCTASRTR